MPKPAAAVLSMLADAGTQGWLGGWRGGWVKGRWVPVPVTQARGLAMSVETGSAPPAFGLSGPDGSPRLVRSSRFFDTTPDRLNQGPLWYSPLGLLS
jgi:hypothetical protein